jgi:hypothetical protein
MSKAAIGARVLYCNHSGYFIADIFEVEGVNVVRANGKVTPGNLIRTSPDSCTHHMTDFPKTGFWRPDLGVFVVPKSQVKAL